MQHEGLIFKQLLDAKKVSRKLLSNYMKMDQSNINNLYKMEKLPEDKLIMIRAYMMANYNYDIRQNFPYLSPQLPPGVLSPNVQAIKKDQELEDIKSKYIECLENQVESFANRLNFIDRFTANLEEQNKLLKYIGSKL